MTIPLAGLSLHGIKFSSFISRAIREGLTFVTANAMADFYRIFRILSVNMCDWRAMAKIPGHKVITPEWYKPSEIKTVEPLQTRFSVKLRTITGLERTQFVTVSHDHYMTVNELREQIISWAELYGEEVIEATPVMALRSAEIL
jgi:hypothetical protein